MCTVVRAIIVTGKPKDVNQFIEETLEEGMVWWDVNVPPRPNVDYNMGMSRKLGDEEIAPLIRAAGQHCVGITFETREA